MTNPQQIISALRNKKAFSYYLPFRMKQAYRKEMLTQVWKCSLTLDKDPWIPAPDKSLPILAKTKALDLRRELAVTT